ncbi:hypothetical protein IQ268_04070 [Oculatella sp. LEGE 06141]|uniref:hypothetical protein n=1 Tax=Oculatella sp. LEGE 06141 TaxID=1828648 RepID=UPI0018812E43|nr:hypothetical protein [Oculatella sp. LEGE 06141]MBE9177756.1 hypothetical protein [Oculatella sp. LEGE 06141]
MSIFRQYIAPFLIVLVFLVALVAVSARIFLPSDMVAPAPIEELEPKANYPDGSAIATQPSAPVDGSVGVPDTVVTA